MIARPLPCLQGVHKKFPELEDGFEKLGLLKVKKPTHNEQLLRAGNDYYCDRASNEVGAAPCNEVGMMEANLVAWQSNVGVFDDGKGSPSVGNSHYAANNGWQRFRVVGEWPTSCPCVGEHFCAWVWLEGEARLMGGGRFLSTSRYGPSAGCAINTLQPFNASFDFAASTAPAADGSYNITLDQAGRHVKAGPVRCVRRAHSV